MAALEIQNVVFACPGDSPESYAAGARPVAEFYAGLLGMRIVREDWFLVAGDGRLMLGFGDGPIDYQAPRWPGSRVSTADASGYRRTGSRVGR